VKVGDLVRAAWMVDAPGFGVVIEMIDDLEVPPVCRVLWHSGEMNKIYEDELETIDECH
jgi:hypothetical protein